MNQYEMAWQEKIIEQIAIQKLLSQKFPKDKGFKSVSYQTDCGITKKNIIQFGNDEWTKEGY